MDVSPSRTAVPFEDFPWTLKEEDFYNRQQIGEGTPLLVSWGSGMEEAEAQAAARHGGAHLLAIALVVNGDSGHRVVISVSYEDAAVRCV
eukprot:381189-Rhodomonas_salina.2